MTDTRLASMKSAATGLVTSLKTTLPDAQVGVISFSDNAVKEHDFAAVGEKASAITAADIRILVLRLKWRMICYQQIRLIRLNQSILCF